MNNRPVGPPPMTLFITWTHVVRRVHAVDGLRADEKVRLHRIRARDERHPGPDPDRPAPTPTASASPAFFHWREPALDELARLGKRDVTRRWRAPHDRARSGPGGSRLSAFGVTFSRFSVGHRDAAGRMVAVHHLGEHLCAKESGESIAAESDPHACVACSASAPPAGRTGSAERRRTCRTACPRAP